MIKRLLLSTAALLAPSAASADWYEASSAHFVVYSDEKPEKLKAFSEKLERFDKAYRVARGAPDPLLGRGNRLTVYVVPDTDAIERLVGAVGRGVAGFYIPRASGSVAFVPRKLGDRSRTDLNADTVFFHEYAHHLMLGAAADALPQWFVEGYAEFHATARFGEDGSVSFGAPPNYRAAALIAGKPIPIERMLAGSYVKLSEDEFESIYGRGWGLAHMLFLEPSRQGQLRKYIDAIAAGTPPLDASRQAFGDLKQLNRDLDAYLFRKRLAQMTVSPAAIKIAPITVRPLTRGEAAFIRIRMRSDRGVNAKTAVSLVSEARRAAAPFSADPFVQGSLAEVEYDAKNFKEAEAAADRALAVDRTNSQALVYKGRIKVAQAKAAKTSDAKTWRDARGWFVAASKSDPEDPEPLMLFHASFGAEGRPATRNAVDAIVKAMDLAPQDKGLRLQVARQHLADGQLAEAKRAMAPVAYNPHGGGAPWIAAVMTKINAGDAKGALAEWDKSASASTED